MKYGKPLLRSALATCILLSAGCQTFDSTFNTFTSPIRPVMASQTNETIMSQLIVLHKAEIAQSKIALNKAQNPHVKAYARKMQRAHDAGLKETMHISQKTGIQPVMNMSAQNIQNESNQQIANLNMLSGRAFDKAYIDDQVHNHEMALRQIDEDIKLSTDPKLTQLLKSSRHHVARHLEIAKKLQKRLG